MTAHLGVLTACRLVLWFDQRSYGGTYVRTSLVASRLCPLVLRARLPARRAYRYGDQDDQQRALDEEMGWGGEMQGGTKTTRATTTSHVTVFPEGNMYVYKLRTYETTRRKPNTGYIDLTAKRDAPTMTNSDRGGHTDKTSTRVQHRSLQLSATSTSMCEIHRCTDPRRDQPRAPHLRDHAQAEHEIRQLDRDVPAMTNGDGGNHTDDNSNPQTPTDSITEYSNEARTNKTGATPRRRSHDGQSTPPSCAKGEMHQ